MQTIPKKNNFDHIRHLLALGVFLFHVSELTQIAQFRPFNFFVDASVAVHSFFIVSGFLIFMSYEKSHSLKRYLHKRFRRIVPGYATVILLSFLFLSLLSTLPLHDYFTSPESFKYLMANLATLNFIHPSLPGVFTENHYTAVNGALWTIKVEVAFYLSVPLIVYLFRRAAPWKILSITFALSTLYFFMTAHLYHTEDNHLYTALHHQLPAQMMFFIGGALIYYYIDHFRRYSSILITLAIFVYLGQRLIGLELLFPLYALSLSVIVIYLAIILPYLGHISKYGDLSYGIYIWHFPMIQTFIALHLFDGHPWATLSGLLLLIFLLAWLSWHLIEKPFLDRRSHYVQESEAD